jgi:undecaprenyl-diphosphatase
MDTWLILVLAVVQGLAELLPVSSSAHVITALKLLKPDVKPGDPEFVFLLVMLHTGTMFAVIVYFWRRWIERLWPKGQLDLHFLWMVILATVATGILGYGLKAVLEKVVLERMMHFSPAEAEIEVLFNFVPLMAVSLAVVGLLILAAGFTQRDWGEPLTTSTSIWIGLIQGLCIPFRGLSRSGATISVGLFRGLSRTLAEEYSFALAVVITPAVILRSLWRLLRPKVDELTGEAARGLSSEEMMRLLSPGLLGMVFAFLAGLLALKLLSALLEGGRWSYFGVYCLCFAAFLFTGWSLGWL